MRYGRILLVLCLLPMFVSARAPYKSEIESYYNVVNNTTTTVRATTTNPFFITFIGNPNTGSGDMIIKCDGTTIAQINGQSGLTGYTFPTPIRCAGALKNQSNGAVAEASLIVGYSMSDTEFNAPLIVSTSTASSGGSTTCASDDTAVCYRDWLLVNLVIIGAVGFLAFGVIFSPLK